MKNLMLLLILLGGAFAVCGNLICEQGEMGSCADCAMRAQNYVCDSFPGAIQQYDPDCTSTDGCYGPDPTWYTYSSGRGTSCFPGRCEGGSCTNTCTSNSNCTSNICSGGQCVATCDDSCQSDTASTKIRPVMSNVYLGKPTYVIFAVISTGTELSVQAEGPCDLDYDENVTLNPSGSKYLGYVIIKVSNCKFSGVGSITLESGGAKGYIHFLSYPAKLYEYGEVEGNAGTAMYATTLNGVPVEVRIWVG